VETNVVRVYRLRERVGNLYVRAPLAFGLDDEHHCRSVEFLGGESFLHVESVLLDGDYLFVFVRRVVVTHASFTYVPTH